MTDFRRFAIFAVPDGGFYDKASDWLGWDSVAGCTRVQPDLPDLPRDGAALTARPRKYGLHGTIKPPFRLAEGTTLADLQGAFRPLCAGLAAVELPALMITRIGGFVAAVPSQHSDALSALAATIVRELDGFRAAPLKEELAKRRKAGLSPQQEALLAQWGYPYVMEEFRFHLTLSGGMAHADADHLAALLGSYFAPVLPTPYVMSDLALMGEAEDGQFHLIERARLAGRDHA